MRPTRADLLLAQLAPVETLSRQEITLVTTDSREVCPGCVFVAFPGARFDGHDFAAEAVRQGAVYAVVNHPVDGLPAQKTILCENSYRAMLAIGAAYRAQFAPLVVGVTGSVGKTTTKQFCAAVLSAFGRTLKTEGNQNNELGVPRTLLRLEDTTQYAVVEMGMSNLGEIDRLTRCARPSAAIITCIGVSHMESLGSRENILRAKLEICAGMPEGAPLALNGDDPWLRGAALPDHVRPAWFALQDKTAQVTAENIETLPGGRTWFTLRDVEAGTFTVEIPALGAHNVANALAAYTVATRLGLDAQRAARALSDFEQTGMRQHLVRHAGVDVIEDCYNANPDSMRAALAMFRAYNCRRRAALLADMLELGSVEQEAHRVLGEQAAEAGLSLLVTYGPLAALTAEEAARRGVAVVCAQSHAQAAAALAEFAKPGDAVLAKGSRSMELEKALALFYEALEKREET